MKPDLRNYAVLWDLDGVLVDTGGFHFTAWKQTMDDMRIPYGLEDFKNTFGMNNTDILEWVIKRKPYPKEVAEISDRKEILFRELVSGAVELLPGVLVWLKKFQAWGAKQAIASSAPAENIDFLVAKLNIKKYFEVIVSGFNLPGKPEPDTFLEAAKNVGVSPRHCFVIEDSIPGVEGAKRAGMKCIAVTTTNPAKALEKADYIIDQLDKMREEEFFSLLA